MGCGKGDLTVALHRAGYSLTAIDPRAPKVRSFDASGNREFSEPGPFDHVVAILSLHHVEDIGGALDKIVSLLGAGGTLVVVEFAWDRIDGATAEWAQCHELLLRGRRRIEKERFDVLSGCWTCSQFLARRTRKSFCTS